MPCRARYGGDVPASCAGKAKRTETEIAAAHRDASGAARIVSSIIVPSQFRAPATRSRAVNGDGGGEVEMVERSRVEGSDAMQWLCSDMSIYVTIVTDTVSATLPKMAVMVLCERIVSSELQRQLQKRALQVRCVWPLDACDFAPSCLSRPCDMPGAVLFRSVPRLLASRLFA